MKPALCGEQITRTTCSDCGQSVVVGTGWRLTNPTGEGGHRIVRKPGRFVCGDCLTRRERSRMLLDRLGPEKKCGCGRALPVAAKGAFCQTCRAVRERGDRRFRNE